MKQGTLVNKIVILVLAGAVAIYLAVYAWNSLTTPFSTVLSYAYAVDDSIEATGFLVREEVVLPSAGGTVELLPAEGERVSKGEAVAVLYQNTAALERRQELQKLNLELEQLRYSLRQEGAGGDSGRLSQAVIDAIVSLRSSVAAGDLTGLEDQTLNLKSLVYQREYTFGDAGSSEALTAAIAEKEAQIQALSSQAAADTSQVRVDRPGIFSGQVDGYESLLTPEGLSSLTPSGLDALSRQRVSADETAVGKLITSSTWYFVCPLPEGEAKRLEDRQGQLQPVTVRFSRDWSGEVDMQVESVSEPENGRVTVVFSSNRFLSDTTLLRRQTVDLIFDTVEGVRIPKRAVRVLTVTEQDEETGAESERQVTGVYALVGAQAEFKPVTVLVEEEDYCLVRPEPPQDAARKILRAGDEIIVSADDLFDGKVVR